MNKDINIPEVKDVHIAAVYVLNESFNTYEWNVYLINNQSHPIETVLVVSKGANQGVATSVLRKQIKVLPAKSFVKLEYLHDDMLSIENQFLVSFFVDQTLFDKSFIFVPNSISQKNCVNLPVIPEKGILAI
jgi:hypothetical protein